MKSCLVAVIVYGVVLCHRRHRARLVYLYKETNEYLAMHVTIDAWTCSWICESVNECACMDASLDFYVDVWVCLLMRADVLVCSDVAGMLFHFPFSGKNIFFSGKTTPFFPTRIFSKQGFPGKRNGKTTTFFFFFSVFFSTEFFRLFFPGSG